MSLISDLQKSPLKLKRRSVSRDKHLHYTQFCFVLFCFVCLFVCFFLSFFLSFSLTRSH